MKLRILISITFIVLLFGSCDPIEDIQSEEFEINVEADSVTFAVIGDYGYSGNNELLVADMVNSWNPDFIITTGDNNYPDGDEETFEENISEYYGDYIYNFDASSYNRCDGAAFLDKVNRFFPSPGNHDVYSFNNIVPYKNFFTLPGNELYYTFTWGDVAFFSLNSTEINLTDQKAWLEKEITLSKQTYKIVYFHHSPYSTGKHGNSPKMQWDFKSLGVDLVFTGHDHIYSRIEKSDEQGLHYIISGVGGKSLYDCGRNQLNSEEFNVICHDKYFGAVRVKVNNERMLLEFFPVVHPEDPLDALLITMN